MEGQSMTDFSNPKVQDRIAADTAPALFYGSKRYQVKEWREVVVFGTDDREEIDAYIRDIEAEGGENVPNMGGKAVDTKVVTETILSQWW